jgi:hypothetical protein
MPQHVDTDPEGLPPSNRRVGMLTAELSVYEVKIGVYLRAESVAVLALPALHAKPINSDTVLLRSIDTNLHRPTAEQHLRKPQGQHLLADPVGSVKQVGMRHAPPLHGPLD